MVQRTTVVFPEDLLKKLRRMADDRGISFAALVREAAEEKVKSYRPKPRSLGMGDSGRTDTSRRIGEEPAIPEPWR
jgi:hypothetical protein